MSKKDRCIITDKYFYIQLKEADKKICTRIVFFFLAPLILLFSLEVMHLSYPNSITVFFESSYFIAKWVISYLFLLALQCFFYTITQSSFCGCLLNTISIFTLAYVTETMGRINGKPLLPTDFYQIGNLKEVVSFVEIPFFVSGVIALVINIVYLAIHWRMCRNHKKRINAVKRLAFALASMLFFFGTLNAICFSQNVRTTFLTKFGVTYTDYDPMRDYNSSGIVLSFFPKISVGSIKKPENYSEAAICALKDKYKPAEYVEYERKPSVIIIQNEAWWNPQLLPEVTYNIDLMAGVNSLWENTVRGHFATPVYAGGTCLPEFEVLTGIPMCLLPAQSYPYTQYVIEETPSIVSAYKQNGYETVAIHPYMKNFYNRDRAYPLLGFDRFIGIEEFEDSGVYGVYVSDMQCAERVIYEFENKKSDNIFQYVVTMENHGTYVPYRYESFDFEMDAPTLTEEDYKSLKIYSQGVYNADKAFMKLVEYFKNVDEPVIIAMYGDHLPFLSSDGSVYMDSGFVDKTEKLVSSDYTRMYETPYIVWTNYDKPNFGLTEKISGNALGMRLFLASGNETPWYLNVANEYCTKYPATVNTGLYNRDSEKIEDFADEDMQMVADYKMLIYDLLKGKKYCIK